MTDRSAPQTVDEYIAAFPADVRAILERIRRTIHKAAPGVTERISYRMPAFALDRDLVYFAAFKKHIGMYPPVRGDASLRRATARYRGEKGNLKFPLDEPIPYDLITRVVESRIEELAKKARARRKKR